MYSTRIYCVAVGRAILFKSSNNKVVGNIFARILCADCLNMRERRFHWRYIASNGFSAVYWYCYYTRLRWILMGCGGYGLASAVTNSRATLHICVKCVCEMPGSGIGGLIWWLSSLLVLDDDFFVFLGLGGLISGRRVSLRKYTQTHKRILVNLILHFGVLSALIFDVKLFSIRV